MKRNIFSIIIRVFFLFHLVSQLPGVSVQKSGSGFHNIVLQILVAFFFFLTTQHSIWHLSSLTRDPTHAPCSGKEVWSLNHWTAREVL